MYKYYFLLPIFFILTCISEVKAEVITIKGVVHCGEMKYNATLSLDSYEYYSDSKTISKCIRFRYYFDDKRDNKTRVDVPSGIIAYEYSGTMRGRISTERKLNILYTDVFLYETGDGISDVLFNSSSVMALELGRTDFPDRWYFHIDHSRYDFSTSDVEKVGDSKYQIGMGFTFEVSNQTDYQKVINFVRKFLTEK